MGTSGLSNLQQDRGQAPFGVHTHSVVMRNAGRLAAHNVRVPHTPTAAGVNISVFPPVQYTRNALPGGGHELLFPTIVPTQEITISYLYYPPLLAGQINMPIRSDEGMARVLHVLPTAQIPVWLRFILWVLISVGTISILYFLVELSRWAGVRFGFFGQ
jgi:hypothetical protein